jgi:hypothetical protein
MAVKEDVGMLVKMNTKCFRGIIELDRGNTIDEAEILDLVDFVNNRYDCADFRLICLVRTYIAYRHLLTESTVQAIENSMLSFKYWMDEPGSDGMCFWSENHQLLFHTCEYLIGNLFLDSIFSNDGKTGKEHKDKARPKIMSWLKNRFTYGFTEWHSNTYYEEDIAPLSVLVDFSEDIEMVEQSKMILDILFLDMAMHSFEGYFVATSGRCYENQKKDSSLADVNDILAHAFGIQKRDYDYTRISSMFLLCKNYEVPQIIIDIAHSQGTQIIMDSMGLDLHEVDKEMPDDDINQKGMFLWSMEAFTNKESINMTMKTFNEWNLKENNFLKDLQSVNIPILRKLGLLPTVVKILNPATQGVAIERANTYTYKTDDYMLSSVQHYHPKKFGDQQHIWQATLPNQINIFSTHPGSPMFDDQARNFSPSFWVGNGINPDAVQHENVLLLMYDLRARKGYLERNRQKFIHFYFPVNQFEEVIELDTRIYGKVKNSYIAILSSKPYEIKDDEEMIIQGDTSQFVVILGSAEQYGLFSEFVDMIQESSVLFNTKKIQFLMDHTYELKFNSTFKVDHQVILTDYPRYDTPFVESLRKPNELMIHYLNKTLYLNFNQQIRKEEEHA